MHEATNDPETMPALASKASKGKAPRKPKGKAPQESRGKRSLNLSLPHEDYERLALHALAKDVTMSEIISELIRANLREFHITRTATRATGE